MTNTNKIPDDIIVGFQVLMATSMKITVFWDAARCSLLEIGANCFNHYRPDDGDSIHL
jgi:hypothetical protein